MNTHLNRVGTGRPKLIRMKRHPSPIGEDLPVCILFMIGIFKRLAVKDAVPAAHFLLEQTGQFQATLVKSGPIPAVGIQRRAVMHGPIKFTRPRRKQCPEFFRNKVFAIHIANAFAVVHVAWFIGRLF